MRNGVLILDARILVLDKDLKSNSILIILDISTLKKNCYQSKYCDLFLEKENNNQHFDHLTKIFTFNEI